ncbi:MAG TPA: FKBP-type peptidyl-prolyl cis-trans isomerase [bacterium]
MKKVISVLLTAGLVWFGACAQGQKKTELKTDLEKVSYVLGQNVGSSLKQMETEIDLAAFIQGLRDTLAGSQPLLTAEEADKVMEAFSVRRQEEHQKKASEMAEKNRAEGVAFMEQNKNKDGVMTTASGLQYEVVQEGSGPQPKAGDRVSVHYRGTFLDGKEFDSSYKRGEPATFLLNQVIPGWSEGVQLMKVGSKYKFCIPSELAYGEGGYRDAIGPNCTLIFEVELVDIKK